MRTSHSTLRGLSRISPWVLSTMLPLCAGCVTYEEEEQRVTIDEERNIARHTDTYFDIGSDQSTAEEQGEDFSDLIDMWKGDETLLSGADNGTYVLSRKVWLEGGKLKGEMQWLERGAKVFHDQSDWRSDSLGYWRKLDPREVDLVRTNGTVTRTDTTLIVQWPPSAREILIRERSRDFAPTPSFADSFRAYLRNQKIGLKQLRLRGAR